MARISDEEVARLKQSVSIERLVSSAGVKLSRRGADLVGLCPFHDDTEPSLVVTPAKNLWHCLGACQSGGSVIDWVMKRQGVSFRHAVELLRSDGPSLAAPGPVVKRSSRAQLARLGEVDEADEVVLGRVVEHYHRCLKESPEALRYLVKRGLRHPEMVGAFKHGNPEPS